MEREKLARESENRERKWKWRENENGERTGWQKLRERGSGAPRKVRVFYERKDLQHTLFCRET